MNNWQNDVISQFLSGFGLTVDNQMLAAGIAVKFDDGDTLHIDVSPDDVSCLSLTREVAAFDEEATITQALKLNHYSYRRALHPKSYFIDGNLLLRVSIDSGQLTQVMLEQALQALRNTMNVISGR